MRFVHVFSSIEARASPRLLEEHLSALSSWVRARAAFSKPENIQLRGVFTDGSADRSLDFPEVRFVRSESPPVTLSYARSVRTYPTVAQILNEVPENVDYVIFTNSDIHFSESAYTFIHKLVSLGDQAFSIHRVTLPSEMLGASVDVTPKILSAGIPHPGSDCFVFPRHTVSQLKMGSVFMGFPPVAATILASLACSVGELTIIRGSGETYHFGDPRPWKSAFWPTMKNRVSAVLALAELKEAVGPRRYKQKVVQGKFGPRAEKSAAQMFHSSSPEWAVASYLIFSDLRDAPLKAARRGLRIIRRFGLRHRRGLRIIRSFGLRWGRLAIALVRRRISLRPCPRVVVCSPGGVATTTLMTHMATFESLNSRGDTDGLKHLPRLPSWLIRDRPQIIYVSAGSAAASIASLRRRKLDRVQALKLARSFPEFVTVLFSSKSHLKRILEILIEAQEQYFQNFSRNAEVLIVQRAELFSSAERIAGFIGIDDPKFVDDFPRERTP
jgi:hypothetical protein